MNTKPAAPKPRAMPCMTWRRRKAECSACAKHIPEAGVSASAWALTSPCLRAARTLSGAGPGAPTRSSRRMQCAMVTA